jgi:hypothetical protein
MADALIPTDWRRFSISTWWWTLMFPDQLLSTDPDNENYVGYQPIWTNADIFIDYAWQYYPNFNNSPMNVESGHFTNKGDDHWLYDNKIDHFETMLFGTKYSRLFDYVGPPKYIDEDEPDDLGQHSRPKTPQWPAVDIVAGWPGTGPQGWAYFDWKWPISELANNQMVHWKTSDGSDYYFKFGPAHGGVVENNKVEVPIDLSGKLLFNAYNVLSKMLHPGEMIFFNSMLEAFFVKEQATIISLLHKSFVEMYYPEVENAFNNSINTATQILLTAVAVANGDYKYASPATSTSSPDGASGPPFDFDSSKFLMKIVKMFFGTLANSVDPTWKTDWFAPGPFTPFGVFAKLLEDVEFVDPKKKPVPKQVTIACDDAYEEQINLINNKPVLNEPEK